MKRREWLQGLVAVGGVAALVRKAAGQNPAFIGPPAGTRGTLISAIMAGPFDASGTLNGVRQLSAVPQFASFVRIQVNPGNAGKIAIGTSAMDTRANDKSDFAFVELWPNYDGSFNGGQSDVWTLSDPKGLDTIDISRIWVWPEFAGEMPIVTAFQMV